MPPIFVTPMSSGNFKRAHMLVLVLVVLLANVPTAECQPYYTPMELSFTVYADGYVAVDYIADVDPTRVRVNISLFGLLYHDLLIGDQDGLPLDSSQIEGGLSIDTLGAVNALISYVTTELTSKSGQIWSITAQTPISSVVLLPEDANLISLSTLPLEISEIDDRLLVMMPVGDIEVSYIIGVGFEERALAAIKDAEEFIQAVKVRGIITTEAENLLDQAYEAFESRLYIKVEQLAEQARDTAQAIEEAASSADKVPGIPYVWFAVLAVVAVAVVAAFYMRSNRELKARAHHLR